MVKKLNLDKKTLEKFHIELRRRGMQKEKKEKLEELGKYADEAVEILSEYSPHRKFSVQYKIHNVKLKLFGNMPEHKWHIRDITNFEGYLGHNIGNFVGRKLGKEVARFSTFKFRTYYDHFHLYDASLKDPLEKMMKELELNQDMNINREYRQ